MQGHGRLDALRAEVDQLTVDAATLSKPARDVLHAAAAAVRDDVQHAVGDLTGRVDALEHAAAAERDPGDAPAAGRPRSRSAGLWKVVECALADQEERVLAAVGRRCDGAESAVKKCVLPPFATLCLAAGRASATLCLAASSASASLVARAGKPYNIRYQADSILSGLYA